MTTLVVIPARGGSKGVPRKNVRPIAGKPVIVYSVESALNAKSVDHVLVTSDSDEILKAAKVADRVICLKRPDELAQDSTPILPVYRHAVEQFEKLYQKRVDYMIGLEPTTPFRIGADIDGALAKARKDGADLVVSVKVTAENPYFVQVEARADDPRWVTPVKTTTATRRQDVPPVYTLNGAVYVFTREALFEIDHVYKAKKLGVYEMPRERSVDLDDEADFLMCEFLLEKGLVKL